MSAGRVILVGAGPGDPGLLTLRGAEWLRRADAVLYDELVNPALLELAPPSARHINVGKRGHDAPTRSQAEVHALLVSLARAGLTVVRLKGGDPMVFGRGGEEASHCAAAAIPCEIVPGVSAALAVPAYAGIPVSDRRHAASFAVVTGHKDPTEVSENTRWEALATSVDTLVILMGMRNLPSLVTRLLAAGRGVDTPAAAIMWGSTPRQRTVVARLEELPKRVEEASLGAPSVVVIGSVVSLRDELAWYERLPLFGHRVLVTRPRSQAGTLEAALRALGAEPITIPTLEIVPPDDPAPLLAALGALGDYDVLLLTSANAVEACAVHAQGRPVVPPGVQVACVGARTAEAARRRGLPVHLAPAREDAVGLAEELSRDVAPAGRRFLLPRSAIAGDALATALRQAGARVDDPIAYAAVAPAAGGDALESELRAGRLAALTFTSPSTVRNFLAMLGPEARRAAERCVVAAIGPTTAAALREAGLPPQVVPTRPDAAGLAEALAAHFASAAPDSRPDGRQEAP